MTAIQEKLDEYGVLDKRLDNEINQTEQRLAFLTRQKELRNKGYNWTEISAIIQDEFNTKNTTGFDLGMMHDQDFRRGSYRGPHEFMPRMELD